MPSSPKHTYTSYPYPPSTSSFRSAKNTLSNFFMDIINENEVEGTQYSPSNSKGGYLPVSGSSFSTPLPTESSRPSSFYSSNHLLFSRDENLRGLANRILFSRFYKVFYLLMTFLASLTIFLSFYQTCPTPFFLFLEILVNVTLVLEVSVRFFATRRNFWKSKANVLDTALVLLCFFLVLILVRDSLTCSASSDSGSTEREEVMLDSILLIFRNALQFIRIVNMLRKNQGQLTQEVAPIDFSSLEEGYGSFGDSDFSMPSSGKGSTYQEGHVPTTTTTTTPFSTPYSRSVDATKQTMPYSY